MNDREAMFKQMVAEYPDSPMGHFSLGKLYLDGQRWAEAAPCFETAVKLDPTYAAAFVALGDAWNGAGDSARARAAWEQALQTPLGRKDLSLQEDLAQRISDL
ncbi:MAG: Tetratricopeptide repeat protein [Myxococcaceae bacterium]|nr:Tetratricopeptide repeat protein [Myxococcaceae bacterium]